MRYRVLALALVVVAPPPAAACPAWSVEGLEALPPGDRLDVPEQDLTRQVPWDTLHRALEVFEEGSLDDQLELMTVEQDPFWILDEPPGGDPDVTGAAVARLRWLLWRRDEPYVAAWIARSLGEWGFDAMTPAFGELENSPLPWMRHAVVLQARWLDDEAESERWLRRLLERETVPWLRGEIAQALLEEHDADPGPVCRELLDEEDPTVVAQGLRCLSRSVADDLFELLAGEVASRRGPLQERAAVALAFASSGVEATEARRAHTEELWRTLEAGRVRVHLISVLDRLGSEVVVREAPRLVWDESRHLAGAAIGILAGRGRPEDLLVLKRRARLGEPGLRAAALGALGRSTSLGDLGNLLAASLAPEEPPEVQTAAVRALLGFAPAVAPVPQSELSCDAPDDCWQEARALSRARAARTDPRREFLPLLEELARSAEGPVASAARRGIDAIAQGTSVWTTACGIRREPGLLEVAEPDRTMCRRIPGRPYSEGSGPRATKLVLGERFDDGTDTWFLVAVAGEDERPCWVTAEAIVPVE